MSASTYYSFLAADKTGPNGTETAHHHPHHHHRQTAVSPSSFATTSSSSTSSLNQLNSLTQVSVASSSSASSSSSTASSCSGAGSAGGSVTSSTTNGNNHHTGPSNRGAARLELLRQSSLTPTSGGGGDGVQDHHHGSSQLFHSYTLQSLEPKPLKPFKSSSDYLEAMKEDLAEWLNRLYSDLDLTPENFFERLETGAIICRHANNVIQMGRDSMVEEQERLRQATNNQSPMSDESYNCPLSLSPKQQQQKQERNHQQAAKSHRSMSLASALSSPKPDQNRAINWFRVKTIPFKPDARPGTFFSRDNICQFILWCRSLNILECLLFETDDLVARKNEKSFILCLLEVARIGFKVGMPTPLIIQLEQEIDREIENEAKLQKELEEKRNRDEDTISHNHGSGSSADDVGHCNSSEFGDGNARKQDGFKEKDDSLQDGPKIEEREEEEEEEEEDLGPKPQVITNDLVSLHEKVVQLLCLCTCPTQFPMVRVGDNGKYKVGDKLIIFVRILRRHIMVRVGGGWQELSEFLRVKDPCRSRMYQHHTLLNQNTGRIGMVPDPVVSKTRLGESTHQLYKGGHHHHHHHYRNTGGQRLISGSASMSWLSHNS